VKCFSLRYATIFDVRGFAARALRGPRFFFLSFEAFSTADQGIDRIDEWVGFYLLG